MLTTISIWMNRQYDTGRIEGNADTLALCIIVGFVFAIVVFFYWAYRDSKK